MRRRLQKWVAMRCRDLFILSWKYKDKQSNTSKEKDGAGGVIADRTPGHTRPKKNPSASLLQHLESRCVYFVCDPLCLVSCSLRACVCVGQEGRKRECERARPVVHVRHCFKRSSYWNGKEWRRAGGEEQATWGGERKKREREQRGHWRAKNPFVTWDTEEGGLICLKVWERPSADSSPTTLPFFSAVCLPNVGQYLTQRRWWDTSRAAVVRRLME